MRKIRSSLNTHPGLWALALVAIPFLLRVVFVASGQLNLVQDEAQYWDWTRHLQLTYYSKGPLIALIISFWTNLLGNTELGVRFGSMVGMALTQIMLYLFLARSWKRPDIGLWTLVIMNTMPLFMGLGVLMTTDNSFVFCWTGAVFSLYLGSRPANNIPESMTTARAIPFVFVALFLGVGILAKYTMLGFVGLSVIYGAGLVYKRLLPQRFWRYLAISLAAGLFIGFLPTLIWNLQNDFVGYKHVLYLIGVSGKQSHTLIRFDRIPDHLGAQFGLATPWWMIFMLVGGVSAMVKYCNNVLVNPFEDRPRMDQRQALLLSVFFWPVWGFFLLWSLHAKIMPNWTTVSYVTGAVLAAYAFSGFVRTARRRGRMVVVTVLALSAFVFVLVQTAHLLPIPAKYNITNRLKGWDQLGQTVEKLRTTEFKDPDKVFVFSELYDLTAALAFYVPGQPRTYCAWVHDRRMNQYDLWDGPNKDKIGWDAILVRKHYDPHPYQDLIDMFDSVSKPIRLQTTYHGHPAREFTLFICRGYNGKWPSKAGSF